MVEHSPKILASEERATSIWMCVCVCVYVCECVYMCVCMCVCALVCARACEHARVCTCVRAWVCIPENWRTCGYMLYLYISFGLFKVINYTIYIFFLLCPYIIVYLEPVLSASLKIS